jgi:hypothetical protein
VLWRQNSLDWLTKNIDTTAPSGRELYNLLFSLQVANPETFGYTLVCIQVLIDRGSNSNNKTSTVPRMV